MRGASLPRSRTKNQFIVEVTLNFQTADSVRMCEACRVVPACILTSKQRIVFMKTFEDALRVAFATCMRKQA
jgi:hypothetical protein